MGSGGLRVMSLSCGRSHMLFLDVYGAAWAVGDARAAGLRTSVAQPDMDDALELVQPSQIDALGGIHLVKASCGNGHSVAMSAGGDIFTWGRVLGYSEPLDHNANGVTDRWSAPNADRGLAGEAVDVAAGEGHVAVASLTGDL